MKETITTGRLNIAEIFKRLGKKQEVLQPDNQTGNPAVDTKTMAEQIIAAHCGRQVKHGDTATVKLDAVISKPQAAIDADLDAAIKPGALIAVPQGQQQRYGAYNVLACGLDEAALAQAAASGTLELTVPETIRFKCFGQLPPVATIRDLMLFLQGQLIAEKAGGRAMEYIGELIATLSPEERLIMAGLSQKLGAVYTVVKGDEAICDWLQHCRGAEQSDAQGSVQGSAQDSTQDRAQSGAQDSTKDQPAGAANNSAAGCGPWIDGGVDADYAQLRICDVTRLEPQLACPDSMVNVMGVTQLLGINVEWVLLGGHGSGWLEELRLAAQIMRGEQLAPGVTMLVTPASTRVFRQAQEEGLLDIFKACGAVIVDPLAVADRDVFTAGLAERLPEAAETVITTADHNAPAVSGGSEAGIYLASAATAAAAALNGYIVDPREYKNKVQ